ncbi:MAG TPA: tetratricopeptide repeat protein [Crocinitomix sp.]|nr:tetratricopeptide repeat protein [Crocinitomix sp.]
MKNKTIKHILLFCLTILLTGWSQETFAQDEVKLADYYYNKGEFDKAEIYYAKALKKYDSKTIFQHYIDCLINLKKYDEAEKQINKKIKKFKYNNFYKFQLANIYELTDKQKEANDIYQQLVDDLPPIQNKITLLGREFINNGKYDYALNTYLKGRDMLKKGYQFNIEIADLYARSKKKNLMIKEYLDLLEYSPTYKNIIQTYLSRNIDFEEDEEEVEYLKNELLRRIQKYPSKTFYNEMLIWLYLQKKEFAGAVIQAKALDKRTKNDGSKVFNIASVCKVNKSYSNARKAYKYIIDLGDTSPYYTKAVQENLEVSFLEITEKGNFSKEDLVSVALDYEKALSQMGKLPQTIGIIERLSKIYAFYLDEPQKAEALITNAIKLNIKPLKKAELKVLLGDIYIVDNRIWEASILYMQVSKDFSEEPIGHEAKYKNAKVFYYDGEFEYAKAQLDVLKASTTKLIANDAMQLSLLLQDNLGIDTTEAPVQMFAKADLLLQQNKYQQALQQLDSIEAEYPFHSLVDEILFKKGEIYQKMQNWTEAIKFYELVLTNYSDDILADDACFRIAEIYEYYINDKTKAAEYYKKILFEFSGSLYTAESRKKYRTIKGV